MPNLPNKSEKVTICLTFLKIFLNNLLTFETLPETILNGFYGVERVIRLIVIVGRLGVEGTAAGHGNSFLKINQLKLHFSGLEIILKFSNNFEFLNKFVQRFTCRAYGRHGHGRSDLSTIKEVLKFYPTFSEFLIGRIDCLILYNGLLEDVSNGTSNPSKTTKDLQSILTYLKKQNCKLEVCSRNFVSKFIQEIIFSSIFTHEIINNSNLLSLFIDIMTSCKDIFMMFYSQKGFGVGFLLKLEEVLKTQNVRSSHLHVQKLATYLTVSKILLFDNFYDNPANQNQKNLSIYDEIYLNIPKNQIKNITKNLSPIFKLRILSTSKSYSKKCYFSDCLLMLIENDDFIFENIFKYSRSLVEIIIGFGRFRAIGFECLGRMGYPLFFDDIGA